MVDETPIVSIENLVKDFRPGFGLRRKRVLDGISFEVRRGEVFGFIGPNGAGKTTTLKVLMGLIRPTSGGARILGHDISEVGFRRHVGFLPEGPYFYDFLTGRETLDFYSRLCAVPKPERGRRVEELLHKVGLEDAADLRLRAYSKGMLQRVGIAQTLVHDPEIVFLDEPMSGLDPVGRKEIRDLIAGLHSGGKTVFMNTHILSDVELICDRIAIIANGRIVHEADAAALHAATGGEVDISVIGLDVGIAEGLERDFDVQMEGRGERIEIRLASKHVDEVIGRIVGGGGHIRAVAQVGGGLEDLFIETIGANRQQAAR
ncbi:MAG: ABC transporter ATP-binding protein [bacterium]|nr:ABC transporter ATP-binding protein [bacterium]